MCLCTIQESYVTFCHIHPTTQKLALFNKSFIESILAKKRGLRFSERFFFGSSKKILAILMGPSLGQRPGLGLEF